MKALRSSTDVVGGTVVVGALVVLVAAVVVGAVVVAVEVVDAALVVVVDATRVVSLPLSSPLHAAAPSATTNTHAGAIRRLSIYLFLSSPVDVGATTDREEDPPTRAIGRW